MKKVYVVTECSREADHECYSSTFSTFAEAQAEFNDWVADFKNCHDMSEWRNDGPSDKKVCSFRHNKEDWFDIIRIEEFLIEDDADSFFTVMVDDYNKKVLSLELVPTKSAAGKFMKDYVDGYVDEYCATVITSDEDSRVKLVNGGDSLHGYLSGDYCISGIASYSVDLKCNDAPIELIMCEEFVQDSTSTTV